MNALPNYIEPAHVALEFDIEAEVNRLCSDKTWEPHKCFEVKVAALMHVFERLHAGGSWTYAMEGIPHAAEWKGEAFRAALMAGDICEIGKLIRESVVREFALNCVEDSEKAWESGV